MKNRWAQFSNPELHTIKRALELFFWGVPGDPSDCATPEEKISVTGMVHEIAAEQRGLMPEPKTKETTW